MGNQTYKLDFGSDEKLYSISFGGEIPLKESKKMLESIQNSLYQRMAENIQLYLNHHHLKYSDFVAKELPLNHETVMEYTNNLLHSDSCDIIDQHIGDADIYYGIMDCQQWNEHGCCEGCYSLVKRIISGHSASCLYKITAQKFNYYKSNDEEQSYFAIRTNDGSKNIHDIDAIRGNSVIPTFGCVDMMGLLLNIDNIRNAGQAERIAIK